MEKKPSIDTNSVPLDFTTFILSTSTAAYMGLGVVPFEEGQPPQINLGIATLNIQVLEMLEAKTQGNLTPDEKKLLSQLLYELKMKVLEKQQQSELPAPLKRRGF